MTAASLPIVQLLLGSAAVALLTASTCHVRLRPPVYPARMYALLLKPPVPLPPGGASWRASAGHCHLVPPPGGADSRALGCLSHAADKWSGRLARRGLSWPWTDRPPRLRSPPTFTPTSPQVTALLQDMLAKGVLEVHRGPVFLSRPFTVPRRDRPEPHLVIDLSVLNWYISCHQFRMTILSQVREVLSPGAWFTALDLANAYWHVLVHCRF